LFIFLFNGDEAMMIYPVGFGKTQDGFIPFKIAETKIL